MHRCLSLHCGSLLNTLHCGSLLNTLHCGLLPNTALWIIAYHCTVDHFLALHCGSLLDTFHCGSLLNTALWIILKLTCSPFRFLSEAIWLSLSSAQLLSWVLTLVWPEIVNQEIIHRRGSRASPSTVKHVIMVVTIDWFKQN